MLSLVDVSAGHVVGMVGPTLQIHLLLSADDDFLAGVLFGYVRALGVHVSHHDALLARMLLASQCRQLPQESIDTLRVTGVLHHVAPEKRHGEDDDFFALVVGDRDDEVVEGINPMTAYLMAFVLIAHLILFILIVLASSIPPNLPNVSSYLHVVSGEEWARSLQSAGGVVVASRDDNLHAGA